jgi:hypothetical protein
MALMGERDRYRGLLLGFDVALVAFQGSGRRGRAALTQDEADQYRDEQVHSDPSRTRTPA